MTPARGPTRPRPRLITREQLRRDAPEKARTLDEVEQSDVVVVGGIYDHVETVLGTGRAALAGLDRRGRPADAAPGAASHRQLPRQRVTAGGAEDPRLRRGRRQHVHHRLGAEARGRAGFPGVLAFDKARPPTTWCASKSATATTSTCRACSTARTTRSGAGRFRRYPPISIVDRERVQVLIK